MSRAELFRGKDHSRVEGEEAKLPPIRNFQVQFCRQTFDSPHTSDRFRSRNTRGQTSGERERIPIISIPTPLKVRRRRAFDRQHCLCSNHRFTRRLKPSITGISPGLTRSRQFERRQFHIRHCVSSLFRFVVFFFFFSFHLPFVRASRVIERAGLDSNLITIPIIPSAGGNSNSPETFGSAASTFIAARLAIVGGT